ncbi:hypothetical protein EDC04DRAFT_369036 [Pisolithus marmoratus]|nr:hypothetical protein EDC04DRAFT_369036 [Pisolithus marmoratus]
MWWLSICIQLLVVLLARIVSVSSKRSQNSYYPRMNRSTIFGYECPTDRCIMKSNSTHQPAWGEYRPSYVGVKSQSSILAHHDHRAHRPHEESNATMIWRRCLPDLLIKVM